MGQDKFEDTHRGQSEAVIRRKIDNTMAKRKKDKNDQQWST